MAEKINSSIPAQERNDGVQLNDELLDVTGGICDISVGPVNIKDGTIDDHSLALDLDNVQTVTGGHEPPAADREFRTTITGGISDGDLSF